MNTSHKVDQYYFVPLMNNWVDDKQMSILQPDINNGLYGMGIVSVRRGNEDDKLNATIPFQGNHLLR
jgi:hypothetical protein